MTTNPGYEPKSVLHFFEEISKYPRGSGNTAEIAAYLVRFAEERKLEHNESGV